MKHGCAWQLVLPMTAFLAVLKLFGVIHWSWVAVCAPVLVVLFLWALLSMVIWVFTAWESWSRRNDPNYRAAKAMDAYARSLRRR